MKKLLKNMSVVFICVVLACMTVGPCVANAYSSDPLTISKLVSLPANGVKVNMGQVRKTNTSSSDNYSTIIAKKANYNGFSSMNVRLYRVQTNGTIFFLSSTKTITPSSSQQKIYYLSGLKYLKNDGIRFEGWQTSSSSKGADVTLYGN